MKKFIYLIQSLESSKYKIGISKNPQKRLKQIQTGSAEEIRLVAQYETENYGHIEKYFHRKYEYLNTIGEWFNLTLENELSFIDECERVDRNIIYLKSEKNEFI